MDGDTGKPAPVEAAKMRAIACDQRVAHHADCRGNDETVFFGQARKGRRRFWIGLQRGYFDPIEQDG